MQDATDGQPSLQPAAALLEYPAGQCPGRWLCTWSGFKCVRMNAVLLKDTSAGGLSSLPSEDCGLWVEATLWWWICVNPVVCRVSTVPAPVCDRTCACVCVCVCVCVCGSECVSALNVCLCGKRRNGGGQRNPPELLTKQHFPNTATRKGRRKKNTALIYRLQNQQRPSSTGKVKTTPTTTLTRTWHRGVRVTRYAVTERLFARLFLGTVTSLSLRSGLCELLPSVL